MFSGFPNRQGRFFTYVITSTAVATSIFTTTTVPLQAVTLFFTSNAVGHCFPSSRLASLGVVPCP
jgi:hypothetical protein